MPVGRSETGRGRGGAPQTPPPSDPLPVDIEEGCGSPSSPDLLPTSVGREGPAGGVPVSRGEGGLGECRCAVVEGGATGSGLGAAVDCIVREGPSDRNTEVMRHRGGWREGGVVGPPCRSDVPSWRAA